MKRVLIMEDNARLAREWADVFGRNGHQVALSGSGEEAIDYLETTKFDLVITDLFVPGKKGGIHVVGRILEMNRRQPPVIVVTGARRHKDDDDEVNFFIKKVKQLGASATLEKPFPPERLLSIANKIWAQAD